MVLLYTQQKESKKKKEQQFYSTLPLIKVQNSQQPDRHNYFSNYK
jgi:hypothetical protein